MRDQRLDRLADVIVRYSTRVKTGDTVAILGDPVAFPFIEAVYEAVLGAGGHPEWYVRSDTLYELMLAKGTDEQLRYCSPFVMHLVENVDVRIGLWAETNTRSLSQTDPARVARRQTANQPIMKRFMERAGAGELRWCGTLFPTESSAQDAEMSLRAYEDFVFGAGLLDHPDPVASWKKVHETQERVREFLQAKHEVRYVCPPSGDHDGTDLRVNVDPSKSIWMNCSGQENFPDGEVFCGPQGADGHVNYTYPAVYNGREVEGVRLQFKGGRVVDASARKNEAFLIEMLDQDPGARTMGEIAIGTNYGIERFTRNTLFDEKIGGTFHAACGAGYPESGSTNESALHWDMVCDLRPESAGGPVGSPGGHIEADGEVFHRNGCFLDPTFPGN